MLVRIFRLVLWLYLSASSALVWAALADNLGVSNKAMSLGNAVTADPPGIMSIHFNPAGLSRLKGFNAEWSLLAPSFNFEADFIEPAGYEGVFGFQDDSVAGRSSQAKKMALFLPAVGTTVLPEIFALPLGGIAFKSRNPKITYGNAIYAPMALGYDRSEEDDPARFGGQTLVLERVAYFSPSIAYQWKNSLSVGFSVAFNYTAFSIKTGFRAPNPLIGLLRFMQEEVCQVFEDGGGLFPECFGAGLSPFDGLATLDISGDDGLGLSYNFGVLWEPKDWFAAGLVYQSKLKTDIRGEFEIKNGLGMQSTFNAFGASPLAGPILQALGLPIDVPAVETGDIRMDLEFPAHVQVGFKIKPFSWWQLNLDWNWSDWGKWEELAIGFDRTTAVLQLATFLALAELDQLALPREYESVGHWSFGMAFQLSPRFEFRLGYEPRKGSIPLDKIDTIAPLGDAKFYSLGFGYRWAPQRHLDFTLSYLISENYVPNNGSCNLNCEGIDNLVYNPYAGLDVDLRTQAIILGATFKYEF